MIRILYVLYGILVLGTLATAEYRGWSLNSRSEEHTSELQSR